MIPKVVSPGIDKNIPNINNKEYLLELLFKFCDNVKIEVPKGINLNNLVDRLIKEIGFTK